MEDSDLSWANSAYFFQLLNQDRRNLSKRGVASDCERVHRQRGPGVHLPCKCNVAIQSHEKAVTKSHSCVETNQVISPIHGAGNNSRYLTTPRGNQTIPKHLCKQHRKEAKCKLRNGLVTIFSIHEFVLTDLAFSPYCKEFSQSQLPCS